MPSSKHEKGTPEYYADLAKFKVHRDKERAKKKAEKALESPVEGPEDAEEVYDLGDPEPARMAAPERSEKVPGKRGRPKKLSKAEMLKEEDVHRYIKQPLDFLSRIEGHEHWRRADDEVAEIAGPATRILNKHPEWVQMIQAVGDPGALIFACVMVLGPSVMEEINRVRGHQQQRYDHSPGQQHRQPEQRQQQSARQPQESVGGRTAGDAFPGPAQVSSGAAAVIPPPADLPSQFVA